MRDFLFGEKKFCINFLKLFFLTGFGSEILLESKIIVIKQIKFYREFVTINPDSISRI